MKTTINTLAIVACLLFATAADDTPLLGQLVLAIAAALATWAAVRVNRHG